MKAVIHRNALKTNTDDYTFHFRIIQRYHFRSTVPSKIKAERF